MTTPLKRRFHYFYWFRTICYEGSLYLYRTTYDMRCKKVLAHCNGGSLISTEPFIIMTSPSKQRFPTFLFIHFIFGYHEPCIVRDFCCEPKPHVRGFSSYLLKEMTSTNMKWFSVVWSWARFQFFGREILG